MLTGGTWGRDSKGGVGLQGGCAGCRVQEVRRQVQQGAEGCGRCKGRGDKLAAGMTSRESRPAIMFLPLWSTTPALHLAVRVGK